MASASQIHGDEEEPASAATHGANMGCKHHMHFPRRQPLSLCKVLYGVGADGAGGIFVFFTFCLFSKFFFVFFVCLSASEV